MKNQYLLGLDLGSSSIKASLLEAESGKLLASAISPKTELEISSPLSGWAEQDPNLWWQHICLAVKEAVSNAKIKANEIAAIGIAYQMHGLVIIDKNLNILRPAIIWCDSRAASIGEKAFSAIGKDKCLGHLLNSPGNFTASKLRWVMENEPETYSKIYKFMLPGDFIAMKLTGEAATTVSGLSEGVFWDYKNVEISKDILSYYNIDCSLIPEIVPTFSRQGELCAKASVELGLKAGIPVTYRAGDQPNNALSLNVLNPGEIAATAGTSGVVYGVTNEAYPDPESRVNTFVHVNHNKESPRYGALLCVNGTGILNSWSKRMFGSLNEKSYTYKEIDEIAESAPPGSEGLCILPFGNGAERILKNKEIGASFSGIDFNRHTKAHLFRAAQEGIVFALRYGMEIMQEMGVKIRKVRAGGANMFLSEVFCSTFASVSEACIELYQTDGSQGAARGAGIGAGIYTDATQAFSSLNRIREISPDQKSVRVYKEIYDNWKQNLKLILKMED